jgi:hypothetical protein
MHSTEIYKKYYNLNEQAVISDDMDERLKGYLNNEDLLEVLSGIFKGLEDGEETNSIELQLSNKEYGMLDGDVLHVKVDRSNPKSPKFSMWVLNDAYIFDKVNIDLAAALLKQSTKGDLGIVGSGLNYLGSLVGIGDPGDDGTDEEKLIGVAAALGSIAADKMIDPKIYFDKLAKVYSNKFGESLNNMIETEFSGRAETVALNTFRQGIPSSTSRGVNLPSILGDIALTIATFGLGTAASASVKTAGAATRISSKLGKVAKSTKVGRGIIKVGDKSLKGVNGVLSRIPGWRKLTKTSKLSHMGKEIKVGSELTLKGNKFPSKVLKFSESKGVFMRHTAGPGKSLPGFWTKSDDFILQIEPGLANRILDGAKLNATTAGFALAAKKSKDLGDASGSVDTQSSPGFVANAAEVMGWYDTLTADPSAYIADIDEHESDTLASMILDLKNGSGFWGNTTNQEELAMALIITSLSPSGAKAVMAEYDLIDPGNSIYAVLDDELGGDMGMFAKAWWAACTGDGIKQNPYISLYKNRINTNPKKKKKKK